MTIGEKIVELRKKNNYTQEKLADNLKVSRQTISNWESDITSPDLKQSMVLTQIFKISLDELVDNKIEIECRKNNTILSNLIGKECYLDTVEEDYRLNYNTICKVLEVNEDFIKIEFKYGKQIITKLIDLDLINSIRNKVI